MISIVIPTYNEVKNIKVLLDKIADVMKGEYEAIVVDDNSPDGTAEKARKAKNTRVIVRTDERGLSSAVLRGFDEAKGDIIGVMDADLSHPPEKIADIIAKIREGYDVVVGSRHVKGGGMEGWPWHRKLISKSATLLARPLTRVKDPMSGFFFMKKEVLSNPKSPLVPRGYKILLEVLVKGRYKRAGEVPFMFKDRFAGKSKLTMKTNMQYLRQLLHLYRVKLF